jgi:hypothetical protein
MRNVLLVMVACTLGVLFAGSIAAGPLSYTIGAGYVEGQGTGIASFGVSKLAWEHFEVAADVAYMHSVTMVREGYRIPWPTTPRSESSLETSFIPVSVGLIGYLRGPRRSGPYAEVSPSLVVNRWTMEGGAGSGKFTSVMAGVKVGLGARIAITGNGQFDLGILYLMSDSGDIGDPTIRALSQRDTFEGLKEVVPFARLSITL